MVEGGRRLLLGIVATGALLAALTVQPALADDSTHVTLIGDSVPDGLDWGPAMSILSRAVTLDFEAATCRRTEAQSCRSTDEKERPPTLIQLVDERGAALGKTVVVMIGYNDFEPGYHDVVGDALDALDRAGVEHVLWLNLHEARGPYVPMNAALESWSGTHPELTVLDWNRYSRSHPGWFRPDGVHVTPDGAIGLATFIHSALVDAGVAAGAAGAGTAPLRVVSTSLPGAEEGEPFSAQLTAAGGSGQYRWKALTGLPHGFELARDGLVTGIPRSRGGSFGVTFRVTDAAGAQAVGHVVLSVRG